MRNWHCILSLQSTPFVCTPAVAHVCHVTLGAGQATAAEALRGFVVTFEVLGRQTVVDCVHASLEEAVEAGRVWLAFSTDHCACVR